MENYGIQLKIVNSCALARKIGHVASRLAVQIVLGWRLFDDTHHVLEEAFAVYGGDFWDRRIMDNPHPDLFHLYPSVAPCLLDFVACISNIIYI